MIRYLILSLCLSWSSFTAFGQIKKGNTAIGGSTSFNISLDEGGGVSFFVSPSWGRFITDKLLISGNLGFSIFDNSVSNSWSISLGSSLRYYLSVNEKISPFLTAGINYGYQDFSNDLFDNHHGYNALGGGGISFHVNEHITLDGRVIYNHSDLSPFGPSNTIRVLGGFSIFLDRNSDK